MTHSITRRPGIISGKDKKDKSKITNILIYDIKDNSQKYMFKMDFNEKITAFYYEMYFDQKDRKIVFNKDDDYYGKILNNQNIDEREIKNKLIIETTHEYLSTIWICDKNGKNLKKLYTLKDDYDWHIDVFNSKIRVVGQDLSEVKIKNFDW